MDSRMSALLCKCGAAVPFDPYTRQYEECSECNANMDGQQVENAVNLIAHGREVQQLISEAKKREGTISTNATLPLLPFYV